MFHCCKDAFEGQENCSVVLVHSHSGALRKKHLGDTLSARSCRNYVVWLKHFARQLAFSRMFYFYLCLPLSSVCVGGSAGRGGDPAGLNKAFLLTHLFSVKSSPSVINAAERRLTPGPGVNIGGSIPPNPPRPTKSTQSPQGRPSFCRSGLSTALRPRR